MITTALRFAFLLVLLSSVAAEAAARKPNLLVILADDLGCGDYSAFGTPDIRTPNLDRLAREGLTFQNFYANSCVCSPTRAALLTGCFPDRVGVPGVIREENPRDSWGYLAPQATLLPVRLKPAGYHSALIGKWHLGIGSPNTPTERGFEFFHGFLGDMMDDYWTHLRNGQNYLRRNQEVIAPPGHATDLFTAWACDYLAERAQSPEPFFLLLAYNAPHAPVQPTPDWLARVQQREPTMPPNRQKLVALIEHLDDGVGTVLAALDRLKLADHTLVLFTSDNGGVLAHGANNGPWRGEKQHLYEGGLRVPGMVRWPGVVRPGSRTERTTLTMDIFATACEVAGVPPPAGMDGVSFLPALRGEEQPSPPRDFYFVRREGGPNYGGKTIEALRRKDWKLVQNSPFQPLELFDLKADPQEANDLAAKNRKVFLELAAALRQQIQRAGAVPWQAPSKTP